MTTGTTQTENGIVTKLSPRPVAATVDRLTELVASKGMKLFAVIDQRAEAEQAGLELRETVLVLFGSPAAGTPVMDAAPLAALDLPLKVLIWDDGGQAKVTYTAPETLAARYGLTPELTARLAGIGPLTDALVAAVSRPAGSSARSGIRRAEDVGAARFLAEFVGSAGFLAEFVGSAGFLAEFVGVTGLLAEFVGAALLVTEYVAALACGFRNVRRHVALLLWSVPNASLDQLPRLRQRRDPPRPASRVSRAHSRWPSRSSVSASQLRADGSRCAASRSAWSLGRSCLALNSSATSGRRYSTPSMACTALSHGSRTRASRLYTHSPSVECRSISNSNRHGWPASRLTQSSSQSAVRATPGSSGLKRAVVDLP